MTRLCIASDSGSSVISLISLSNCLLLASINIDQACSNATSFGFSVNSVGSLVLLSFHSTKTPYFRLFILTSAPYIIPTTAITLLLSLACALTIPSSTSLSAVSASIVKTSPCDGFKRTNFSLYFRYGPYGPNDAVIGFPSKVDTVRGSSQYATASSKEIRYSDPSDSSASPSNSSFIVSTWRKFTLVFGSVCVVVPASLSSPHCK